MDLEHGSRSTKLVEPIDGSGSSSILEKHSDPIVESQGIKQSETFLEVTNGSELSIRHPETQLDFVDTSGSGKKLEDLDESERNEYMTPHTSSSLSSSELPTDPLREESNESTRYEIRIIARPTIEDDETSFSSDSSSKSEEQEANPPDPELTSQASDVMIHESNIHSMPSPQIQTMDRAGGYDPQRIPSSVFERSKSTTPMEWSVASNESLFSIHVGNSSFSRDNLFLFNDLNKSGELAKSGELTMFSPPVPVPSPQIERKSPELGMESAAVEGLKEKTIKDAAKPTAGDSTVIRPPVSLAVSSNSSGHSHHSDESGTSTRSFAFPVKKKQKCAWRLCYCSNCSWAFCYFRWPRCHFSWQSCYCSNCSWAFCYGWNCSKIRMCCHSSSILPGLKSESMRPETEKLHPETPAARATSKSAVKRWFPCLSWCPRPSGCSWRRYCCTCF
ncbi:hypothetical protein PanWU01x14_009190 [Parasponia andersonii]|uniref:Uncharacterized protein n=1 Tax=Parasponia andersonii TaxID=3476 RepID=A0A2P5E2F1_PARAD|nr:hypothetical protein PanWU01x14_009190 [Parasponia andersonii]